jgi:hypothetical protein
MSLLLTMHRFASVEERKYFLDTPARNGSQLVACNSF